MSLLRDVKKKLIAFVGVLSLVLSACVVSDGTSTGPSSSESQLKIYDDPSGDFSFAYPKILSLSKKNDVTIVSHAVPYPHSDPCDFKDGSTIPLLTDFSVQFALRAGSLMDILATELHWTAADRAQYVTDGELIQQEGFLEKVAFNAFGGYSVEQGVEGCGHTIYFLQKNTVSPVLVITRKKITELSDIITNAEEYRNLPGVILPKQEEQIFYDIMQSMK